MTRSEFQKLHGFASDEMTMISSCLSIFNGQIVSITNKLERPIVIKMEQNLFDACCRARELAELGYAQGLANHISGKEYGYTGSEIALARNELKNKNKFKGATHA